MKWYIKEMSDVHPENIISNEFLTNLNIGTNNDWILERVGIRERRSILQNEYLIKTKNNNVLNGISYTHEETKKLILKCFDKLKNNLNNKIEIDLVIAGSSGPTRLAPADSATFANILNLNVPCIDINSACTSWAAAIHFIKQFSLYKNILLINCETPTARISYSDRKNCVLVGDCCVMTLLTSDPDGAKYIIDDSIFESNPSGCDKVVVPIADFFNQDGSAVQKFAISKMSSLYDKLCLNNEDTTFIGHQANLLALNSVVERSKIINHLTNIEYYGNSFAAGAPSVLSENFNKITTNYIVMCLVGSGLSWGAIRLKKV